MPDPCKHCGHGAEPDVRWQTFENGTRHLRAVCESCRGFLCYLPQTPGNVAMAKPELPPAPVPDLFDTFDGEG